MSVLDAVLNAPPKEDQSAKIPQVELNLVELVVTLRANGMCGEKEMEALGAAWRALLPAKVDQGERLANTLFHVHRTLSDRHDVHYVESVSALCDLVMHFPAETERWNAVRDAMQVACAIGQVEADRSR